MDAFKQRWMERAFEGFGAPSWDLPEGVPDAFVAVAEALKDERLPAPRVRYQVECRGKGPETTKYLYLRFAPIVKRVGTTNCWVTLIQGRREDRVSLNYDFIQGLPWEHSSHPRSSVAGPTEFVVQWARACPIADHRPDGHLVVEA
jgi:hypothetical protein